MPLFLVEGRVKETWYMAEDSHTHEDIRIVEADTEGDAQELYEKYWSLWTEEYSVYYYAEIVRSSPVITKKDIADLVAARNLKSPP